MNIKRLTNKFQFKKAFAELRIKSLLGADTETSGLDPFLDEITLIQLGDETTQYVFDVMYFDDEDWAGIKEILEDSSIIKIFHNAVFDYKALKKNTPIPIIPEGIACTLIFEQLLMKGKAKYGFGLDKCLKKYLDVEVEKALQGSFIGQRRGTKFTDDQIRYAGVDVKYSIPLFRKQRELLVTKKMLEVATLECECVAATGDLELNGIYLDRVRWTALYKAAEVERDRIKVELDKVFAEVVGYKDDGSVAINYNSPIQLRPALEKFIGKPLESTNARILAKLNHSAVKLLLKYREQAKLCSTYGENFFDFINPATGRIHASFNQTGKTDSGRYSSNKPNMQNIPATAAYRAAFTPQHQDWKLICADYSGCELRILAELSEEPAFLDCLKHATDNDLHTMVASRLYGVAYKDVTPNMRKRGKAINFSNLYGAGPGRLAEQLDITWREAKGIQEKFFAEFREVAKLLNGLAGLAQKNKYAWSPLDGRRRDLSTFDWDDPRAVNHAQNIAKNLPFQGLNASITKLAMIKIRKRLIEDYPRAMLVCTVHDELEIEVSGEQADELAKVIEELMLEAAYFYIKNTPMKVDVTVADCWVK